MVCLRKVGIMAHTCLKSQNITKRLCHSEDLFSNVYSDAKESLLFVIFAISLRSVIIHKTFFSCIILELFNIHLFNTHHSIFNINFLCRYI